MAPPYTELGDFSLWTIDTLVQTASLLNPINRWPPIRKSHRPHKIQKKQHSIRHYQIKTFPSWNSNKHKIDDKIKLYGNLCKEMRIIDTHKPNINVSFGEIKIVYWFSWSHFSGWRLEMSAALKGRYSTFNYSRKFSDCWKWVWEKL